MGEKIMRPSISRNHPALARCAVLLRAQARVVSRCFATMALPPVALVMFWLAPSSAQAQEITLLHEYGKVVQSAEVIGSLGPDAFGEQTNFYTGNTEFTVTDIELPGPGLIPVRLGRRYVVEDKYEAEQRSVYPFGDWQIDLPHVHGTFARTTGWSSPSNNRCTDGQFSQPWTVPGWGASFGGSEYWHGNHLYMPGAGEQEMLYYFPSANPNKPTSGGPYYWVTQGQWFFSCLTNLATGNGYPGQGFLAIDPQGTKYTFDWMVPYRTQSLIKPLGMPPLIVAEGDPNAGHYQAPSERQPGVGVLERDDVWIYPTRIEDRFGNTLIFTWSGAKLMQMTASDGRTITFTYVNDVISTASDGTRTWTYGYDPTGEFLTSAQRPDGSAWGYQMSDLVWLYPYFLQSGSCNSALFGSTPQTSRSATITHPAGAVGTFTFQPVQHGRAGVPYSCVPYMDEYDQTSYYTVQPRYFSSLALKSKVIAAPSLTPSLTWQFDYGTANASWETTCGSGCITTKTVTVTGPDEVIRHTFGTRYGENEGRLLKRETGPTVSTTLRTETLDYQQSAQGLAYPAYVGFSPRSREDGMAGRLVPQKSNTIAQDGGAFGWAVAPADFDNFARPTKTTFTGLAGSSNVSRVESVQYHDHLGKWVLGQTKKRICTSTTVAGTTGCSNTTVSETTFDASTALPLTHAAYGQVLQTLAWNTDGTLASSKDALNHTTTFTNWHRGVPKNIGFADATGVAAAVNGLGWITSITNELGYATGYQYDLMGRLNGITWPTGDSTAWANTSRTFARLATVTGDDLGIGVVAGQWKLTETTGTAKKETYFDALWRPVLTREQDTSDATTKRYVKRKFDSVGRETFVSYSTASYVANPTGIKTTYDALGRITKIEQDAEDVDGNGTADVLVTNTYYESPFKTRTVNPKNHETTTTYFAIGEPNTSTPQVVSEPGGVTTTYTRDAYGKPLTLTRSGSYTPVGGSVENLSLQRRFVYDPHQRLCKTIEPDAGITVFDYDAAGNLLWKATGQNTLTSTTACQSTSVPAAERSTHHYDARNRLIAINHPAATDDIGYSYEGDGALQTATTGTLADTAPVKWSIKATEWTYSYNKRRLLTEETLVLPSAGKIYTLAHTYTPLAHEASLAYPDLGSGTALTTHFNPNALGQPRQAGTYATSATYFPNGQIKSFTYGNAITRTVTQNIRGLPSRILDQYGSTKFIDQTLGYDANGNLGKILDGTAGAQESRTFLYDSRNRLTTVNATPSSGSYIETYDYDPLDRLRRVIQPNKNWYYSYHASTFRLDTIKNASNVLQRSYTWNARGEWQSRTLHYEGNPTYTPPTIFQNGFEGALISTTHAFTFDRASRLTETSGITYLYDAHGRRVRTVEPMWGTRYQVYDRKGTLRYIEDTGNNERTEFIHLNGQLVGERTRPTNSATATTNTLHADQRGTPSVKTASNRTPIYRSWSNAYGDPHDGIWRDGPGFTGHAMDPATQLIYMQQRYHDPESGFISPDPVAASVGSFSRFWYANANPYTLTDPDGREPPGCRGGKCSPPSENRKKNPPKGCGITRSCVRLIDKKWYTVYSYEEAMSKIQEAINKYGPDTHEATIQYNPRLNRAGTTSGQIFIIVGPKAFGYPGLLANTIDHEGFHVYQHRNRLDPETHFGEAQAYRRDLESGGRFGLYPPDHQDLVDMYRRYYSPLTPKQKAAVDAPYGGPYVE
jgi:RHS repeat-associated protein